MLATIFLKLYSSFPSHALKTHKIRYNGANPIKLDDQIEKPKSDENFDCP